VVVDNRHFLLDLLLDPFVVLSAFCSRRTKDMASVSRARLVFESIYDEESPS
jgi:hypothetical protein